MFRKFLKVSVSIALVFSLAMLPSSSAFSKAVTDLTQSQSVIETTTSITPLATTVDYSEAKKLAEDKSSILTTLYGITSIQYALIDHGEIVFTGQAGVYSKNTDTALTEDQMYGVGSISKIFTTVAVMQLVEQGKVDLDTPIVNYITEFTMADPRYKDITARMLLNHSSGLMGSTFTNSFLYGDTDSSSYHNILNALKTSRLKATPGEFSVYCNDGFTLAELLVEKVTGISFTEYLKNNISAPLGLSNTKTPQDYFQRDKLVKTYLAGNSNALPSDSVNMIGAGGIYSSATDLCRFAEVFMEGSTSTVLTNTSASAMENSEYLTDLWPQETDSILSYGLGWDSVNTYPYDQYGIKALIKGGDTLLFHGNLTVLPDENMAIAVLSSGGSSMYNQVMAQEILLAALKSKGTIKEIKADKTFVNPIKVSMPSSQKQYEGIYASSSGVIKIDISDKGTLTLSNELAPNAGTQEYIYCGDNKFYYADGSVYLSFVEESNGNIYLYGAGYSFLPGIGQLADAGYQAQKLNDNPLTPEMKTVWEKRVNNKYFLINEKYTSQVYALSSLFTQIPMLPNLEGYCLYATIQDENTARTSLQIPGVAGRDLSDFSFYKMNGIEYLEVGVNICISEAGIKPLSTRSKFTCKVKANGYAVWYKISKESSNKKIKVTVPKNASFAVYDANGSCINYSYITNQNTVTLPEGGYIVFAGEGNAKFTVKYVK